MTRGDKPCPKCGGPMRRWSVWQSCSRCRGVCHKPRAGRTERDSVGDRATGSAVPLPRPALPNGGLLIDRADYDRVTRDGGTGGRG